MCWASQVEPVVKTLPANAEDASNMGWIPGSGRSPGEGNGKPLQYSCLENSMDRGAWQAAVHGVARSRWGLSLGTHTLPRAYAVSSVCEPSFCRRPGCYTGTVCGYKIIGPYVKLFGKRNVLGTMVSWLWNSNKARKPLKRNRQTQLPTQWTSISLKAEIFSGLRSRQWLMNYFNSFEYWNILLLV